MIYLVLGVQLILVPLGHWWTFLVPCFVLGWRTQRLAQALIHGALASGLFAVLVVVTQDFWASGRVGQALAEAAGLPSRWLLYLLVGIAWSVLGSFTLVSGRILSRLMTVSK